MTLQTLQLIGFALAPAAVLIGYVWLHDRHEKEPVRLLFYCFLFGCLSVVPAIALETLFAQIGLGMGTSLGEVFIFAFVTVAFSEEISKYYFLRRFAFRYKEFDEPYDGIMYMLMIGMGFASVENLIYVLGQETFQDSLQVAKMRAWTAVPAHATFAVLMGYFAGLARFNMANRTRLLITGLLLAIAFHGAYDFFLMQQSYPPLVGGALLSLIAAAGLSWRAIRRHQLRSPHA